MKYFVFCLLVALSLLGLEGCKKKQTGAQPLDVHGVKVDVQKLDDAFATAPPEILSTKNDAVQNIRYGINDKAFEALDKLVNNPALTDPQKKAVNEVIEQMKQVVSKPASAH